jgi:hypothetical protein
MSRDAEARKRQKEKKKNGKENQFCTGFTRLPSRCAMRGCLYVLLLCVWRVQRGVCAQT